MPLLSLDLGMGSSKWAPVPWPGSAGVGLTLEPAGMSLALPWALTGPLCCRGSGTDNFLVGA